MTSVFLPALVLMLITLAVWLNMTLSRVVAIKANDLDVQAFSTPEKFNAVLNDRSQALGNCYKNLFEVPVIFYALTAFVAISTAGDALYINMAWAYVGLRALQACVHCTYNRVMHRFYAYLASCLVLWVMVIRFFLTIF